MSLWEIVLVHVCSALVIAVMLAVCLRSPTRTAAVFGREEYRVHWIWFVFAALGGAFVVGIFAIASTMAPPDQQASGVWCSVGAAIFFAFFALVMRSLGVTVDDGTLTARNLFNERTVAFHDVERVGVVGLVVEVRLKDDPATKKRRPPLIFLAGFRGLTELMATIRARAGLGNQ